MQTICDRGVVPFETLNAGKINARLTQHLAMTVLLLQFPYSHYNEKARWALDYKGIEHRRQNMLPGPHRRRIMKLTGRSTTPVMVYNDEVVPGSHNIVLRVEQKFPDTRRLLPDDPAERSAALTIATSLDEVLGPAVNLMVWAALLQSSDYGPDLFLDERSRCVRWAYRKIFPRTRRSIEAADGICETSARAAAARTVTTTMDRLCRRINGNGYLAGDSFSVADLTASALLAPLVNPPHPDMRMPEPFPNEMAELHALVGRHPISRWVLHMYERHRPQSISGFRVDPPR